VVHSDSTGHGEESNVEANNTSGGERLVCHKIPPGVLIFIILFNSALFLVTGCPAIFPPSHPIPLVDWGTKLSLNSPLINYFMN